MKKIALHWQVIIALVLGVMYAVLAVNLGWQSITKAYISPFGDIFINLLKLIAVPLVLFSIITGIGSLKNIKQLGRVGVKTLLIYIGTTMSAILIGLLLVNLIKPGNFTSDDSKLEKRIEYELWLMDNPHVIPLDNVSELSNVENEQLIKDVQARVSKSEISLAVQDKINKANNKKNKAADLLGLVNRQTLTHWLYKFEEEEVSN